VVGVNLNIDPTINPTSNSNNYPTITLNGPDWIPSSGTTYAPAPTTKLIIIDGAIGAYTSTVELDYDPLWTK
jgi:hypothetical protein